MKQYRLVTAEGRTFIHHGTRDEAEALNWTSLSEPFETKDELLAKKMILGECECGDLIQLSYGGNIGRLIKERKVCFNCAFWIEKIELPAADAARRLIINGTHFMIEDESGSCEFSGHGGRKFRFRRFGSGFVEETTNLWDQGEIPKRFRDRLPDNAQFVA